jgi:hypothetical protein
MNKFPQKLITGLVLAFTLISIQAQAEMQIMDGLLQPGLEYSDLLEKTDKMPCYISGAKAHPKRYEKIVQAFKDAGLNITDEESGYCKIVIGGKIAYTDTEERNKTSYVSDLLDDTDKLKIVEPYQQPEKKTNADAAVKVGNANEHTVDPVGGSGVQLLTQIGGLVKGTNGGVVAGGLGTAVNILSNIQPEGKDETLPGEAVITVTIMTGHFIKNSAVTCDSYITSTTPEKPIDMIAAGVKQIASDFHDMFHPKGQPSPYHLY